MTGRCRVIEPREWWIDPETDCVYLSPLPGFIRVIEYSAYAKLANNFVSKTEYDALEAQLERERAKSVVADTLVGVNEQLTAARKQIAVLKAQVEREINCYRASRATSEALELELAAARAEIAELSKDPMLVYCRKITLLRGTIAKLEAEVERLKEALKEPVAYRPPSEDEQRAFTKRFIEALQGDRDRWREMAGRMAEVIESLTEGRSTLLAEYESMK